MEREMGANVKRVVCTLIVQEFDDHGGKSSRTARVDVEASSVSQAFQVAQERAMAQLKNKR